MGNQSEVANELIRDRIHKHIDDLDMRPTGAMKPQLPDPARVAGMPLPRKDKEISSHDDSIFHNTEIMTSDTPVFGNPPSIDSQDANTELALKYALEQERQSNKRN